MEQTESFDDVRVRLNAETARVGWKELERHFARGVVIRVDAELDLVEVAARMARDDKQALEKWLVGGQVGRPSMDEAASWWERNADFWAVVTAPFVLIQEIRPEGPK